jgi:nitroreductase
MTEFTELLKKRRSIRDYDDREVFLDLVRGI